MTTTGDAPAVLRQLQIDGIDGMLLDLGVSSYQLDNEERGFSYRYDTPLDMRMDQRSSFSAREIINEYSEMELFRVIRDYGGGQVRKEHCQAHRGSQETETNRNDRRTDTKSLKQQFLQR